MIPHSEWIFRSMCAPRPHLGRGLWIAYKASLSLTPKLVMVSISSTCFLLQICKTLDSTTEIVFPSSPGGGPAARFPICWGITPPHLPSESMPRKTQEAGSQGLGAATSVPDGYNLLAHKVELDDRPTSFPSSLHGWGKILIPGSTATLLLWITESKLCTLRMCLQSSFFASFCCEFWADPVSTNAMGILP